MAENHWLRVTASEPAIGQFVVCTDGEARWLDKRMDGFTDLSWQRRQATHYFPIPNDMPRLALTGGRIMGEPIPFLIAPPDDLRERIKAAVTKYCHVNMKWPATAQLDDLHFDEFVAEIRAGDPTHD
jgi:hypothetical protein